MKPIDIRACVSHQTNVCFKVLKRNHEIRNLQVGHG
ncbi:hypothetical protein V6Z11_A06G103200 [Gossypium hirsutum]